jgi:glycosyltransferase involved in cell wall biosynthesis
MTISVALCTYNGAKFLQEQLASIASQTRSPDEVVICDDGSTDETLRIAHDFANACPFIVRIYTNTRNIGSSKNFERAIGLCTRDIITLADQDDIWRSDKLACIESAFACAPDLGALFSDALLINAQGVKLGSSLWSAVGFVRSRRTAVQAGRGFDILLLGSFVTGATLAFRAIWRDLLLPIPPGWVHDYWIALLLAAASRLDFIDAPLIEYRCHPDQERGVKSGGLAQLWRHFIDLDDAAYRKAAAMRMEVAERLGRYNSVLLAAPISKCHAMVAHLQRRGNLPSKRLLRIRMICRETANGNYFRHSSGLKSILRDILASY